MKTQHKTVRLLNFRRRSGIRSALTCYYYRFLLRIIPVRFNEEGKKMLVTSLRNVRDEEIEGDVRPSARRDNIFG